MDMGFTRERVLLALTQNPGIEAATEWLLNHTTEEEDILRAITMSLENAPEAAVSSN